MDFPRDKIGQRKRMSECDVLKLKKMYNCHVSECKDYYKEPECKKYKKEGKCRTDRRIKKLCKKTCKSCNANACHDYLSSNKKKKPKEPVKPVYEQYKEYLYNN